MADFIVKGEMALGVTSFLRNMAKAEAAMARAERDLNRLDRTLDKLEKREVNIKTSIDTASTLSSINKINQQLNKIRNRTVRVNTVQTGSAQTPGNSNATATTNVTTKGVSGTLAQLAAVNAAQNKINKQPTIVSIFLRGGEAVTKGLDTVGSAMQRVPISPLTSGLVALGTMAIPGVTVAAGVLAGGLGSLATTGFGALAGVGAVVPAFMQVKSTMEELEKAQKAVAEAKTAEELAAAHDNLRKILEGMPPGMEAVINKVNELKEAGKNFGASFRTETFDLFTSGMDLALKTMDKVEPISKQAVRGFQDVVNSATQRIDSGEWDNFFGYLERNSRGFIRTWGDVAMNFATGVGNMIVAFDPLTQDFNSGLLGMSEDFKSWSETLKTNQGFQDFINYVQENGPKVWNTVKQITEVLWNLGTAVAPVGMELIELAGNVAEFINDIQDAHPEVFALVTQMGAWSLVIGGLLGPLGTLLRLTAPLGGGLGLIGRTMGGVSSVFGGALGMMRGTNDSWNRFAINTGVATERLTGSARAGSGAMSAISGLGKAIPVAGAAIAASSFIIQSHEQDIDNWASAIRAGGARASQAQKEMANPSVWQTVKTNFTTMFTDIGSSQSAAEKIMEETNATLRDQWNAMTPLEQASSKVAEWTATLSQRQRDQGVSSEGARSAAERLKYWRDQEKTVTDNLSAATQTLTDKLNENTTAAQGNINAGLAASNADIAFRQSMDSLASSQNNLTSLQKSGTATEQQLRAATDQVTSAQNSLTQSAMNAANKARDLAISQNQNRTETERARFGNDAYIRSLEVMAGQASGPTRDAINQLIAAARSVPNSVSINVQANTAAAHAALAALNRDIAGTNARIAGGASVNSLGLGRPRAKGGTVDQSKYTLVGEQGPEYRFLNRGDYIATAAQTKQILAAQRAGSRMGSNGAPSAPTAAMYAQASAPRSSGGGSGVDMGRVLEAVRAAVNNGKDQTIIVQIDGREIARAVNKVNSRNGART